MGWITRMLSPEDPSAPLWPTSWLNETMAGNDSGIQLTELNSRSAAGVLACVRVISEAVAAYPKEIYQRVADGKRLATEHALYPIINGSPNPQMTNFVFWVGIISQTCIWGNGYAEIQRDGANRPRALWPLPSGKTRPVRENGVLVYKTTAGTLDGHERSIAPENIIHLPFLSFDGLQGYSPIQLRRQGIGLNMAAERFGSMLFGKGARPSGVLEVSNALKPEQRANLKQSWQEGTSGANALGVALMEPGVTFKPLTINPADAQFLETRKYQLEEIARDYRVPAHMIGILERATHSNAEQLGYDFNTYTMLAWVLMVDQELTRKLMSGDFYVKCDMDIFLRGDFETRMAGWEKMRNIGVRSGNDICRAEGWPLIPAEEGGDVRIVPMNYVSLKQVKANEDKPMTPEPKPAPEPQKAFESAFRSMFLDATGRTISREKKDAATVQRVWTPVLTGLAESIAASNGRMGLPDGIASFIADYAGSIAQRCGEWKSETLVATALQEFKRAFAALTEKL